MEFFFFVFIFILGSAVGSFLGVVVDRIVSNESIWKGRSHCDHCRHKLQIADLLPVVSFFALGRKCRYCHKSLSWFYPTIEIVTGLLFVLVIYSLFQSSWYMLSSFPYTILVCYYLFLISSLVSIIFIDFKFGIIPFKIVIFAASVSLLWYLLFPFLQFSPLEVQSLGLQTNLFTNFITGSSVFLFFFLLFAGTKGRGMGFGDVVYAFLMGFALGFPTVILALYIAFVSGALVSLVLIALGRKKFKGGTIAFGPFLVLGTIIGLLWGHKLISYIMQYFMF